MSNMIQVEHKNVSELIKSFNDPSMNIKYRIIYF